MFDKTLENVKSVKLTGGIFGKTFFLLTVLSLSIAAVAYKIDVWWAALILLLPLMFIVFYAVKRCFDFADANPHAAIMDGAELLVHERILQGRKGLDVLPSAPMSLDHEMPALTNQDLALPDVYADVDAAEQTQTEAEK